MCPYVCIELETVVVLKIFKDKVGTVHFSILSFCELTNRHRGDILK